jgi:signal peptidase II
MNDALTRRTTASIVAMLIALIVSTAADLGSKAWAAGALSVERAGDPPPVCQLDAQGYREMQRLRTRAVGVVDGWLELRYAENCGAAFGMLDEAPRWIRASIFFTAAAVAIVALLGMYVKGAGGPMFAAAVPLIVSGALGNLVDRVRLGYVVDFIRLYHVFDSGPWEYPTFNIADSTITVGVVLLFLDGLRKPADAPAPVSAPATVQEPE